jgi:hypothetical protein
MFELLILAGIFTIGFGAGYGVRELISRRHRRRSRPLAGYGERGEPSRLHPFTGLTTGPKKALQSRRVQSGQKKRPQPGAG